MKPLLALLSGLILLTGCAGTPKPTVTRLAVDDINYTTQKITDQLRSSELLVNRTSASPKIVITCTKLQNLSMDQIKEGELWLFVAKVQNGINGTPLAREKNVSFQIPPDRLAELQKKYTGITSPGEPNTHTLTASVNSSRRSVADKTGYEKGRSDLYYFEYTILRLADGKVEWSGTVDFQKAAFGQTNN